MDLFRKLHYVVIVCLIIGFTYFYMVFKYNNSYDDNDITDLEQSFTIVEPIKQVDLTIVGDFLYEEPYYEALRNGEDGNLYFSKVKKFFENDLSIGNMEVVITDGTMELSGVGYSFCAPRFVGDQVALLGMDVMSTANNHSNDRGQAGRVSTINYFKDNSSILTVGTYDEARDVYSNIKEVNGIKFGFLSYTYGTNVVVDDDLRYSIGLYKNPDTLIIDDDYLSIIENEVNALRSITDCLVVMLHFGDEFTFIPNAEQEFMVNFLNNLGVDIIIGNHSHSIQPIKWIRGSHDTLVYYSLGNFVSADHIVDRTGETFTNAYQLGLLSKVSVSIIDGKLDISNVRTEPIVDYYDVNLRNFILIPFSEYDSVYETSHYLYNNNFNKEFIINTYSSVIDEEFRKSVY